MIGSQIWGQARPRNRRLLRDLKRRGSIGECDFVVCGAIDDGDEDSVVDESEVGEFISISVLRLFHCKPSFGLHKAYSFIKVLS
jgi:hypothetical protein